MATNSQPQETPEYRTFREHYARLVHAIQNPLYLATHLFTRNIIDSSLLQRVNTLGFTTFQNTTTLLTAVLGKIQTDPRMFSVFLSALNEDPSMWSLVESMQGKCFTWEGIKPFDFVFPHEKQILQSCRARSWHKTKLVHGQLVAKV